MSEHQQGAGGGSEDETSVDEAMSDASGDTAKAPSADDPTSAPSEARDPDREQG
jgi:hypothetical protein